MENESIIRIYGIYKILYSKTDEEHYLTTNDIIDLVEQEYGIKCHRTTVNSDILLLNELGFDVDITKSTQNRYRLLTRQFDTTELKLLADAVESSRFITRKKSKTLIAKLSDFASESEAESIKRNLYNEEKLKSSNEKILYIADTLNDAINLGRKISFLYYGYAPDKSKKLRNDGKPYVFSPYFLIWHGDNYYVVGYSDKHDSITNFRVDRIYQSPEILDEKAKPLPKGFSISNYMNTMFSMYSSERKDVRLKCENSTMDTIIDRFGEDTKITNCDNEHFFANINISINHIFFSWIFGFGGAVTIDRPNDVKEKYKEMLNSALEREN